MRFRYEEDFIEAVVFICATGRRKAIPSLQIARFHREREKVYAVLDPEERNAAFFQFHLSWFREWGLEEVLTQLLKEYPLLPQSLSLLVLRQTRGKADEGAELYVNDAGERNAVVALRPDFFTRDEAVRDYLRHEFMHLNDMVDPSFGYRPSLDLPGLNSAQQRLARERYRLIWDVTIDGRLAAKGQPPLQSREHHASVFARSYSFWTEERQASAFDSLWLGSQPSHSTLLEIIDDPRGLRDANTPSSGAPCPLCAFPTFAWADLEELHKLRDQISAEFANWQPTFGACQRCVESYRAILQATRSPN